MIGIQESNSYCIAIQCEEYICFAITVRAVLVVEEGFDKLCIL